jgi:hypothetical protein
VVLRFYSPLYARRFEDDREVEIWSNELLMHKDEILTALTSDYRFPSEKGLL